MLAGTPLLARTMGLDAYQGALRILLINTFVIGFYFIPFHVLRMTDQPATFVALTTSRSAATLLTRFALIIGVDLGVTGFVLADLVVSAVFTIVMLRWFRPLIRRCSRARCSRTRCASACRGCRTGCCSR